jgi:plastocyanin
MDGMPRSRLVTAVVAWAAMASMASGGPVTGRVQTLAADGIAPATAIVYAEPLDGPPARGSVTLTLGQKNKTFQPHILAVPVGATVAFPNGDQIFHNVFSLSGPQPFDLGLYRGGATRQRQFTRPGNYRVFCNIHPHMTALVVVVPTPYTTTVGPDGRFVLDLPPGRYRVSALSERTSPASVDVTSTPGATTAPDITLDERSWAFVQHKNKHGQEYPAAAYKR